MARQGSTAWQDQHERGGIGALHSPRSDNMMSSSVVATWMASNDMDGSASRALGRRRCGPWQARVGRQLLLPYFSDFHRRFGDATHHRRLSPLTCKTNSDSYVLAGGDEQSRVAIKYGEYYIFCIISIILV